MRHGATPEPGAPGRRCRSPEPTQPASSEQDPIQRLFAIAYMQAQKGRREAEGDLRKDSECVSAVIATQQQVSSANLGLDQSLELIAEQARRITGAGGAAIALRDQQQVVCRGRAGLLAPELGARLDPQAGISGTCLRTGEIQQCDDSESDPRVDVWVCRNLGIRAVLAVPIRRQHDVVGIIEVFSGWAGVFSDRDVRSLTLLAALVIEVLWSQEVQERGQAAPEVERSSGPAAVEVLPPSAPPVVAVGTAAAVAPALEVEPVTVELKPDEAATAAAEVREQVEVAAPAFAVLGDNEPRRLGRVLGICALAAAVIAAGSEIMVWHGAHVQQIKKMLGANHSGAAPQPVAPPITVAPVSSIPETTPGAEAPTTETESTSTPEPAPSKVISIQHLSKPDGTTVAVFLAAPARWDSGVLSEPERIYFDLDNTDIAADLLGNSKDGIAIPVNDGRVQRIRLAPKDGKTRVVMDLAKAAEYSAVLSPAEPYRLMIAIRDAHAPAPSEITPSEPKTARASHEPGKTGALSNKLTIVIDPGHGGSEDGAIGHDGLKEKDLVLEISKRLGELLKSRLGVDVIYTRTDDRNVPLEMRAVMANEAGADLFVSVHANYSSDTGARGVETYYVDGSPSPTELAIAARENATSHKKSLARVSEKQKVTESQKLASDVQQALYRTYGGEKGVLNRGVKRAPFVVLLDAEMPSILAEVAFVSSPTDEHRLNSAEGQEAMAEGLYRGITRYLSGTKRGKALAHLASNTGQ